MHPTTTHLRRRLLVAIAGLGILVAATYLALVIVTRIDELFFPGQGLSLGGLSHLPGVQGNDAGTGQINILVMGLDRRPSEGKAPTRTDTMFVLTIDRETKTAGILGIPRDLWVDIPYRDRSQGVFQDRINTAYVYGENGNYSGGGAKLAEQVVERNLGIPIDHYIIIDFQGFIKVIDGLGGVDVYVDKQVDDPYYSETEAPGDYHPLHFEIGMQHMNGQTALDYSRTRFDSSDLDRIHRQQQVIFAAIDKALAQNLVHVDRLASLWGKYKNTIVTDINDIQTPGFASLAAQIDPQRIVSLSLGPATVSWTTPTGAEVLLADKQQVQEIVQALFNGQQIADEAARVEVQNGTGTDGLAQQVIGYLSQSFPSNSLSAATSTAAAPARTEIIDFTGKQHTVDVLAGLLSVAPAQVRAATPEDAALRTVQSADVVVILGADARARDFAAETPGG